MPNPENGIPDKQSVSKHIMGKTNISEDEIDLVDYLRVLWKRKYFILLLSVLPALIVFLVFNSLPKQHVITYIYDTRTGQELPKTFLRQFEGTNDSHQPSAKTEKDMFEMDRKILVNQFYSQENLGKIAARLRDNGLAVSGRDISKSRIKLEISEISSTLTITGNSEQDVRKISSIVREDFEKVIPIYALREELNSIIAGLKTRMAEIEGNSYSMELELERKRAILKKMKDLQPSDPNKLPGGIILQIDNINKNSEYLPLAYQIQAIDTNIISIEQTINTNQKKYIYYKNLISINEKLFEEINNKASSYYTVQEFHSFLVNLIDSYSEKELAEYLSACTKRIENIILINIPVTDKPSIYPIPKDTIKKSMASFAVLLIITSFMAFLSEAIQQK